MTDLYKAIARSMGGKYLTYAMQFASLAILARLFTPETFGLVASVQVFYVFFQLLADGGLAPAVIGLRKLEPRDRDGIFGLTILTGLALGVVFYLSTPAISNFYSAPQLGIVIPYIAIALIFNAMGILPIALLQRQQAFYSIAIAGFAGEAIALAAVCVARAHMDPLHALSLRLPVFAGVNYVLVHHFSRSSEFGRPRPGPHFSAVRPLLRVSAYQLAFNSVNYFSRNLDKILVGKYMGPAMLGIYDRSYSLMRYPLQLLTFAMTPAIQPALRMHENNPVLVRSIHNELTIRLSLLGVLCATAIYFLADQIVRIAFGGQWISAVPIIKVLSLSIPVQVVLSTSGSFFQIFKRTDLMFACGVFSAITNVCAIVWGVSSGSLETMCWALFVSFHVNFVQAYYLLHRRVLDGGFGAFMLRMVPAAIAIACLVSWDLVGSSAR